MNVNNIILDENQVKIIRSNAVKTIVIAGAGSGKTTTIIGKINYLVNEKNYNPSDILCISFTNEAVNNIKEKCLYNIDVFTFHKFSLSILKDYKVLNHDLLGYVIDEYFKWLKYNNKKLYALYLIYYKNYKQVINRVINIIKINNYSLDEVKNIYKYNKFFLMIILSILKIYNYELESTGYYDFNDMINVASTKIKEKNIRLKYKYIIIDEFQDISLNRLELINNVIKNNNAKLLVVGDDYQSIFKFAGSNLSVFNDFCLNSKIFYLEKTYRNSQELIDVAGSFIMKNKHQQVKHLKSDKHLYKPIVIVFYNNISTVLKKTVSLINTNYLILGRTNKDIELYDKNYKDKYLTMHKSKGLECDNIIIINMNYNFFPSTIRENKYLKTIISKDEFNYAEERRLFYVALTRTKNKVYLLCKKNNSSVFIDELLKNKDSIEILTFS